MIDAEIERLVRLAYPDSDWEILGDVSQWVCMCEAAGRRSALVHFPIYGRERGRLGTRPTELPWDMSRPWITYVVVDRDLSRVRQVPDGLDASEYFRTHVQSLARERRLAEIKSRNR